MIFIESRLRSLMTYRQARPDPHHVAAQTKEHGQRFFKICKTVSELIPEKLYQIMLYMFYLQSMNFKVSRLLSLRISKR